MEKSKTRPTVHTQPTAFGRKCLTSNVDQLRKKFGFLSVRHADKK